MCTQGCTTAITATPPLSLSLVHLNVAGVARVTCANVTPAGPDHVTMCSRDTHHCYALFSSLEGTLLVLTPNQNPALATTEDQIKCVGAKFYTTCTEGRICASATLPRLLFCSQDHDR